MPRERRILVYKFDELSDKAKEKARQWWRDCEAQTFGGHPGFYEFAETAGERLGIEFAQTRVVPHGGEKFARSEPKIFWGLHTQGSGAAFEGTYSYRPDAEHDVVDEFGDNAELLGIANALRLAGKDLTAKCDYRGALYPHSGWMNVTVYNKEGEEVCGALLRSALRAFADWIYRYIAAEWDYTMSDEQVDESITCNDYEFEVDGTQV